MAIDWLTEREVVWAAEQGKWTAWLCSLQHWWQIITADEDDYKAAEAAEKVSIDAPFCAVCRYYKNCSTCPLKQFDNPRRQAAPCCGAWEDVRIADVQWTTGKVGFSEFQKAAQELFKYLIFVFRRIIIQEEGTSSCLMARCLTATEIKILKEGGIWSTFLGMVLFWLQIVYSTEYNFRWFHPFLDFEECFLRTFIKDCQLCPLRLFDFGKAWICCSPLVLAEEAIDEWETGRCGFDEVKQQAKQAAGYILEISRKVLKNEVR